MALGEINSGNVIELTVEQINDIIKQTLLAAHPVGSIYQSLDSTSPETLFGGKWERIASDMVLMGASSSHIAGSTVEAGLPNITGSFSTDGGAGVTAKANAVSGCFSLGTKLSWRVPSESNTGYITNFNASLSSSIYGKSSTVQPPAYYVYMWKRTA